MTSQKGVVTEPGRGPGPGVLGGAHRSTPPDPRQRDGVRGPPKRREAGGAAPSPRRIGAPRPSCRPGRAADTPTPLSGGWGTRAREGVAGGGFPSRAPQRGQCKGRPRREAGTTERTLPGRARVCAPECGGLHGRARAQGPRVRGASPAGTGTVQGSGPRGARPSGAPCPSGAAPCRPPPGLPRGARRLRAGAAGRRARLGSARLPGLDGRLGLS